METESMASVLLIDLKYRIESFPGDRFSPKPSRVNIGTSFTDDICQRRVAVILHCISTSIQAIDSYHLSYLIYLLSLCFIKGNIINSFLLDSV